MLYVYVECIVVPRMPGNLHVKGQGQTHVHTFLVPTSNTLTPVLRTYFVIPVVFIFDVCKEICQ